MNTNENFIKNNYMSLSASVAEEFGILIDELNDNEFDGFKKFAVVAKFNGISAPVALWVEIDKLPNSATGGDYSIKVGNVLLESSISAGSTAIGVAIAKQLWDLSKIGTGFAGAAIGIVSAVGTSYIINHDGKGLLEDLIDFKKENYVFNAKPDNATFQKETQDLYTNLINNKPEFHYLKEADKLGEASIEEFRSFVKDMMEYSDMSFHDAVKLYISGYFDKDKFIESSGNNPDSQYYIDVYNDYSKDYGDVFSVAVVEKPKNAVSDSVINKYDFSSMHQLDGINKLSPEKIAHDIYNKLLDKEEFAEALKISSKEEFS